MITLETPVNATGKAKELFSDPNEWRSSLSLNKRDLILAMSNSIDKNGVSGIGLYDINTLSNNIIETFNLNKKLDYESKTAVRMLLLLTLSKEKEVLSEIRSIFLSLIKLISENEEDFGWFYDQVISNFTESQLTKLIEAYSFDSTMNIKSPTKEQKIELLNKLIILSTNSYDVLAGDRRPKYLSKNDSPSFFGLDNSAKEAVCWQQLEMSQSHNIDYARIAANIAWKTWLFKRPLLEEYCHKNNIDYETLSFSERANLTRKAVLSYSETEIATILNSSIEIELEKRKSQLKVEKNQKFINKRVSMGIELEIGEPPFETALIYAWYENLDREQDGDSIAYSEKIEEMFKHLSACRDKKQELLIINEKLSEAKQILKDFLENDENKKQKILDRVKNLINDILDETIKNNLLNWLETNEISEEFLEILIKYFYKKSKTTHLELEKSDEVFYSFLEKKSSVDYLKQRNTTVKNLPLNSSDEAHILMDLFSHHMGEIQAIGHPVGGDAYGEYNLEYTSPNFKNPYRVNMRQTWELAEAGFHDLELESKQIHATIGWKEDKEIRNLNIFVPNLIKKASIINFALMTTGWTNMQLIIDIKKQNAAHDKDGMTTIITQFSDTGKRKMLFVRSSDHEANEAIEFRGLRPKKNDHARLFSALGNLGTIMKANLVVELGLKYSLSDSDDVDRKLSDIWEKFEKKVLDIYDKFDSIPSLFNANDWVNPEYLFGIKNFYHKIIEDLDKNDGVVIQMRNLIRETTKEIEAAFEE